MGYLIFDKISCRADGIYAEFYSANEVFNYIKDVRHKDEKLDLILVKTNKDCSELLRVLNHCNLWFNKKEFSYILDDDLKDYIRNLVGKYKIIRHENNMGVSNETMPKM